MEREVINVETKQQLEFMDVGQLVKRFDRVGVYGGLEWVQMCTCPVVNTFQFPTIIYPLENGDVEVETIYFLEEPIPRRINGYSTISNITIEDKMHRFYEKLIQDNLSPVQ